MTSLVTLESYRRRPGSGSHGAKGRPVHFNRTELFKLLGVYSRRVMSGEWRDYAIDHGAQSATFSIFRHAAERPIYAITKHKASGKDKGRYVLTAGPKKLKQAQRLEDVIDALERQLRVVWTSSL